MHEQCATHKRAVEAVITLPATTKDVGELLSSVHASEKATNRQCLLKILSNLRFFARQGSAIRGHGDETDSNYYQLLKLRGEDDEKVIYLVILHKVYRIQYNKIYLQCIPTIYVQLCS